MEKCKSFSKTFQRRGPKADPWGQPLVVACQSLVVSRSILTRFFLFVKYDRIRAGELLEKSYAFSLLISKGRYSESNGQESHNVPVVKSPFSQSYPSSGQCLVSVSFDSHRKAYSSWNP